jgi:hypothetical protein
MLKANTRAITTIQVKGKAQEIQVYELMWQQSEDMTTLASHKSVFKPRKYHVAPEGPGRRAHSVLGAAVAGLGARSVRRTLW